MRAPMLRALDAPKQQSSECSPWTTSLSAAWELAGNVVWGLIFPSVVNARGGADAQVANPSLRIVSHGTQHCSGCDTRHGFEFLLRGD